MLCSRPLNFVSLCDLCPLTSVIFSSGRVASLCHIDKSLVQQSRTDQVGKEQSDVFQSQLPNNCPDRGKLKHTVLFHNYTMLLVCCVTRLGLWSVLYPVHSHPYDTLSPLRIILRGRDETHLAFSQ